MANKKAFLVTFVVTTRITAIPDENGDLKDEDIVRAKKNAADNLKHGIDISHLDTYTEDTVLPYDPKDDDNSEQ